MEASVARFIFPYHRAHGCRVTELSWRGLRTVVLENRVLRVTLLVDQGADIVELRHKPSDLDVLWRSPLPPRRDRGGTLTSASPLGAFLDYYEGGWQEILPSIDLPDPASQVPQGVHGEVALIPWEYTIEVDEPERVAVRFFVRTYRTPYLLERTMELRGAEPALFLYERLVNEGAEALSPMWGHHPAFGPPFLEAGCRVDLPDCQAGSAPGLPPTYRPRLAPGATGRWPLLPGYGGGMVDLSHVPGPEAGSHSVALLWGYDAGWYALTNPRLGLGVGLAWDRATFPVLAMWQPYGGAAGYPWYGRVYALALEPWNVAPHHLQIADVTEPPPLGPGEARTTSLTAVLFEAGEGGVERVHLDGSVHRRTSKP